MAPNSRSPTDRTEKSTHSSTRRRVLKTSAGVVAATGAVSVLTGTAAAHFPDQLVIDVKPGCTDNPLDVQNDGDIPVAVLSTEFVDENGETVTFDPTERAVRYRFGAPATVENGGGARPVHDGECTDEGTLVLQFPIEDMGFEGDETTGKLLWERDETGEHGYAGTDTITVSSQSNESVNDRGAPHTSRSASLFRSAQRLL
ncbi:hypothetical protein [Saliphagus infecundisoli]|uniref:Uncharacterized protein n=1 Tax=Saliphagus infecundisoli TaxID=1849069 RepID=A0ABD5QC89_9EURY|nr:hypothetical protein [Saliphagus infecundisoli]